MNRNEHYRQVEQSADRRSYDPNLWAYWSAQTARAEFRARWIVRFSNAWLYLRMHLSRSDDGKRDSKWAARCNIAFVLLAPIIVIVFLAVH